jgi:hypothetical protein
MTTRDMDAWLPHRLLECVRVVRDGDTPPSGEFVLYWMHRLAANAYSNTH